MEIDGGQLLYLTINAIRPFICVAIFCALAVALVDEAGRDEEDGAESDEHIPVHRRDSERRLILIFGCSLKSRVHTPHKSQLLNGQEKKSSKMP